MPKDKLLAVAKGRIWTGEDAKALGLIDELGGFPLALRLAKEAAGMSEGTEVQVEVFPRQKPSLRQVLMERLFAGDGEEDEDTTAPMNTLVDGVQKLHPLFQLARKLGLDSTAKVLSMPEVETVQ